MGTQNIANLDLSAKAIDANEDGLVTVEEFVGYVHKNLPEEYKEQFYGEQEGVGPGDGIHQTMADAINQYPKFVEEIETSMRLDGDGIITAEELTGLNLGRCGCVEPEQPYRSIFASNNDIFYINHENAEGNLQALNQHIDGLKAENPDADPIGGDYMHMPVLNENWDERIGEKKQD